MNNYNYNWNHSIDVYARQSKLTVKSFFVVLFGEDSQSNDVSVLIDLKTCKAQNIATVTL